MRTLRILGLSLAFSALFAALSGCATFWVVDSEVRSHSTLQGFAPGAGYRFERLPSQNDSEATRDAQTALEGMAAPALAAVGLRPDEAAPRYTVQVTARVTRVSSPLDDPWMHGPWGPRWAGPWGWGWGPGWAPSWYGGGWYGAGFHGPPPQPWYLREVSVVLRQLPGHEVVYETRARHDGPYNLSHDVLPVMFRAALEGFPAPPAGERRVDIPLGAAPSATPATVAPARP